MSNVRIQGNASGTGTLTFQAPNTNTDRTLNIPDNAGTFITTESESPPKVPAFKVRLDKASDSPDYQSISDSTWTKHTWDTTDLDTHSWFDMTNNRYTPQQAGWYQFSHSISFEGFNSPADQGASAFYNASNWRNLFYVHGATNQFTACGGVSIYYMNGSTDYMEVWGRGDYDGSPSARGFLGDVDYRNFFAGVLIRSGT